jgi:ATP synthase I chain
MADESENAAIERRIELLIAAAGFLVTLGGGIGWGLRAAEGAAIGAALCWLNFHWLRQGAAGVIRLGMAQAGAEHVAVPRTTHAKFLGRFALLLVAVYAILVWLRLPAVAVLCGLAAVVPAIVCELGYELMRGHHRWQAR